LERLKASHPVSVTWYAFELRPPGSPPLPPEYRQRIEASRPRLEAIAREQYNLNLNPGPFGLNSRPALVGAKFAETQGVGEAYNEAVLHAYWHEAQNIEDRAVLLNLAERVGLAPNEFSAALADPQYTQAVLADVALAQHYGLTGVPALIFGRKYLVSGAQPYEVLTQVVEQIQAEQATPDAPNATDEAGA
jgi:predicted DsbA family dithiol-disulfide isomerase